MIMIIQKQISDTIIYTDLDGTLLDHNTYSFEPALEMLRWFENAHIPLIIVTSKTKDEVLGLQKLLNINYPFIVENGAGIITPGADEYATISMGFEYEKVRSCFENYAKRISMRGFYDMSVEEVAKHTSLPIDQAPHAKARLFTEPFILENSDDFATLKSMAEDDGLQVIKGGRFYHLITKGQDKARAIQALTKRYEELYNKSFKTVALGDSFNDLTMLQSVDTPVLIPHPDGSYMPCDIPKLVKAPFPGPKGWNSALKKIFDVK